MISCQNSLCRRATLIDWNQESLVFFCGFPCVSAVRKRVASKRVVWANVPRYQKTEGGYVRMFPQNRNRNEGTFAKTTLLRNRPFISQ